MKKNVIIKNHLFIKGYSSQLLFVRNSVVGLFLFHPVISRLFRATARSDSSLGMYFHYRTTFGLQGDAMPVHGENAPCWVLASLPSGICLYKARHMCPPGTIASKIVSRLVPSVSAAVVYPVPYRFVVLYAPNGCPIPLYCRSPFHSIAFPCQVISPCLNRN